jgi:signal transduction histidine kinase
MPHPALDLLTFVRDARLAPHATDALPAWLWADDGTAILWANAAGALVFGARSVEELRRRRFAPNHPAAQQVARLGSSLREGAAPRLERLRGFGTGFGRPLVCACARIRLIDDVPGVLVTATQAVGPSLSLQERVRMLFAEIDGPMAIFAADGNLLYATAAGRDHLDGASSLNGIGAEEIGRAALAEGHASGRATLGNLRAERLGTGNAAVLLTIADDEARAETEPRVRQAPAPAVPAPPDPVPESAMAELASAIHGASGGDAQPVHPAAGSFDPEDPAEGSERAHPAAEPRPQLTLVPPVPNVVPFRAAAAHPTDKRPVLTPVERTAFQEIARALGARIEGAEQENGAAQPVESVLVPPPGERDDPASGQPRMPEPRPPEPIPSAYAAAAPFSPAAGDGERAVLERIPVAVLVYRGNRLLYANRALLDWTGYENVEAVVAAGGIERLFAERAGSELPDSGETAARLAVRTRRGEALPVEGRLFSVAWAGETALLLVLTHASEGERLEAAREAARATEARVRAAEQSVHELETRLAQAEEALRAAEQRAPDAEADLLCSGSPDFLERIDHAVRVPLNKIVGFSETMLAEHLGPLGHPQYRAHLQDIRATGAHAISLVGDLVELSKIEAGKLDLGFGRVDLNDLVQECVTVIQPQANRDRVIIRTSLAASLPPVIADARSLRQVVFNLLSSSMKLTGAGGQVIVSTARGERGEASLRVRDTGRGMSEDDLAAALDPFRRSATGHAAAATLVLPLAKALAQANGARFTIRSSVESGTLAEITFPRDRIAAR